MKETSYYQPEIFGILIGLALLNIWYLSGLAIDNDVVPKSYDYIIKALTVAVGAFIGAFSAFWLKQHEETKENRQIQIAAINSALFVLIRQINAMHCIKRNLEQYNTPLERALSLPAFEPPNYSDVRQEINKLNFLIDNGKADELMRLTIEQERFEQAINSIKIRNKFYVNEVQPALSYHSLNGQPLPISEFENKLGERLFQGSISGAEIMYDLVYSSHESLKSRLESLEIMARELFPNEKFIGWEPNDKK